MYYITKIRKGKIHYYAKSIFIYNYYSILEFIFDVNIPNYNITCIFFIISPSIFLQKFDNYVEKKKIFLLYRFYVLNYKSFFAFFCEYHLTKPSKRSNINKKVRRTQICPVLISFLIIITLLRTVCVLADFITS